jgi:hypothetical protein
MVKVLYDDKNLYIGFLCIDKQPDMIIADVTEKDGDIRVDDSVYILLDIYENLSNFYYFGLNSIGTIIDGTISKDGRLLQKEWDGEWEASAQKTPEGWTSEIAIDLSYFMYKPEQGQSIGICLSRVVSRLDSIFWTEHLDPAFKISEMGGLKVLTFSVAEKWFRFIPHILSRISTKGDISVGAGLDVPLIFTEKITSHLTIYPDFYTTEPDQEFFNLTKYEPLLPEKREYFREPAEYNRTTQEQLFYSKRQNDLYGGFKFRGEFGGFELTAMSNQAQKEEELGIINSSNFSVFQVKLHTKRRSSFGIMVSNKLTDSKNIGVAGINGNLQLGENLNIVGQFATSFGEYNSNNQTFSVVPNYESENIHFHVGYVHVGKYFGDNTNAVGYVWDDNRREVDSGLDLDFVLQKWGIERIGYKSNYNVYWGTDGTLRSWHYDHGLSLFKQNRFEVSVSHLREYKLFDEEYRNNRTRLFIGMDTREWQLFNLIFIFGHNFNEDFSSDTQFFAEHVRQGIFAMEPRNKKD